MLQSMVLKESDMTGPLNNSIVKTLHVSQSRQALSYEEEGNIFFLASLLEL